MLNAHQKGLPKLKDKPNSICIRNPAYKAIPSTPLQERSRPNDNANRPLPLDPTRFTLLPIRLALLAVTLVLVIGDLDVLVVTFPSDKRVVIRNLPALERKKLNFIDILFDRWV